MFKQFNVGIAVAAFLCAAGSALAQDAPSKSEAPMRSVEDYAEAPQTFYPIGQGRGAHLVADLYLLGGALSVRNRPIVRATTLVNVTSEPRGQIVEISSLNCATHTKIPSFDIVYDAQGHLLAATGPAPATRPSPVFGPPVERMVDILCSGHEPPDALKDRTLADFRAAAK